MMGKTRTKNSDYGLMLKKDFKRNRALYMLAIPFVAYFIIFKYIPMYGILMSFQDYSPMKGIAGSEWVGFKHFVSFFRTPSFISVLRNTLTISLTSLVVSFPLPIILALLLNEVRSKMFAKVVQNISYIPHFISTVIICGLIHVFTSNTGLIGGFFVKFFGLKGSMLIYPQYFVPIYVISGIWASIGWNSIIYTAALSGIDQELYEAAKIDGANRFKQTLHVTIPGILPTIVIMLILAVGNILNVGFEKILLLYNDATIEVADVISTYTYRRGIEDQDFSYSTAVGLFTSVVNFIFLTVTQTISKKVSGTALW